MASKGFLERVSEKIKGNASESEAVKELCKLGWKKDRAKAVLKLAKDNGISYSSYLDKHMYDLTDDEVIEFAKILKQIKKNSKDEKEFYARVSVKKSGLSRSDIDSMMRKAKLKGISAKNFAAYSYWNLNDEERDRLVDIGDEKASDGKERRNLNAELVAEKTGWPLGKVHLEINRTKAKCGIVYEDYRIFNFHKLTLDEQAKYITREPFTRMRLYYNDYIQYSKYFDDKAGFNRKFGDFNHRVWFENNPSERVSENEAYYVNNLEEFAEKFKGISRIIFKPSDSMQGAGIETMELGTEDDPERPAKLEAAWKRLQELPTGVVEQYIIQHPAMAAFAPQSVNTVRFASLNFHGEFVALFATIRLGMGQVVDNFHAGGITVPVDVNTGMALMPAVNLDGKQFETHPLSGIKIEGFKVPNWDIVRETVKQATGRVEGVNMVGWDLAITPEGVELIEGNPNFAYAGTQVAYSTQGVGMKDAILAPYLKEIDEMMAE